jgi:hypothetical protein
MKSEATFLERRKHSRDGVLGELENITYSILRQHGVIGESSRGLAVVEPITQ